MRYLQTLAPVALALGLAGCFASGPHEPDPKSVAIYDVANDSFRKGQLREALSKVNEALDADHQNVDAAHLGALIYLAFCAKDPQGSDCRFADAAKLAQLAVDNAPEFREAKNTLGVALIHMKKYDDAIAVLKPLAEDILYGSPQVSWGNLGWAYLEKGSTDEAIDALRRSVAAQPSFCVGNFRLGLAYEKQGQQKLGYDAFGRAVETERPGCKGIQEAWEGRGRIAKKLGLVEEARTAFHQCVELSKSSKVGARCNGALRSLPHAAQPAAAPAGATPVTGAADQTQPSSG
jgi:type IV pilus assembly protein PilF